MKVLSLRQPWADLIKYKYKKIETRSWKTNYRGELYIHASKAKINIKKILKPEILDYINIHECEYGAIILKCQLVDCIYMDKDFVNKIKKNKMEFICGNYEEGRYAWVLDKVEILKKPIFINGQLGLWNYKEK
ncbi:MAG: ASCH domain-containing protein [Bacilli bacterium]|jgi:hypothetical protein